jgi:hypothetical protein
MHLMVASISCWRRRCFESARRFGFTAAIAIIENSLIFQQLNEKVFP